MCTIALLVRAHPAFPLIVAANRDELFERASSAPEVIGDRPRAVAGVDREKGGSWLGATAGGLFVGLTNQRTYRGPDPALRSRGHVVREALQQGSRAAMRRYLERLDPEQYNPFNLIYGDAEGVEVAYARPSAGPIEIAAVGSGIAVLCNDRLGSAEFPKARRMTALLRPLLDRPWPELVAALGEVLGDHELPDESAISPPPPDAILPLSLLRQLQALCIHTEVYGTCSSTILALGPGRVAHYLFAAGPPCRTPFREVRHLFHG